MDKYQTLDPVIIRSSPTTGNYFGAVAKSYDANIKISDNFQMQNISKTYIDFCSHSFRVIFRLKSLFWAEFCRKITH